jgi:glutamine amidotransferase
VEGIVRVTLFDYGAGNLHSLTKALVIAGAEVRVESDAWRCLDADVLVLPGVGAFAHAAERLQSARAAMRSAIEGGLPTLGICLGMQLLFAASDEGEGDGLGMISGRVERLTASRVPQIGWNTVRSAGEPLLTAAPLAFAYYANAFCARPLDASCVTAWTTYDGDRFPAIVRRKRAIGVQFHPEKSSAAGIAFLAAAVEELAR